MNVMASAPAQRLVAVPSPGNSFTTIKNGFYQLNTVGSRVPAGGDYPDVHFMLGELYRDQGKRLDAEGEYRRALQLNSNYTAARDALAAVAIK